jgi:hypothetical protein
LFDSLKFGDLGSGSGFAVCDAAISTVEHLDLFESRGLTCGRRCWESCAIGSGKVFVCNCRPLCIVSSTRGDPRPDFFWQLRDWDTADRYPHSAGSTSASVDVLTGCEEDDRMMTGGLHSVASASCHSLVDTGAWVPSPCHTCRCAEPGQRSENTTASSRG